MKIYGAIFAAAIGLGLVYKISCVSSVPKQNARGTPVISHQKITRIELGPLGLRYFEDDNVINLTVEMASDSRGSFYIVYLPSPTAWSRDMPGWCRNRRQEVLAEIRRLTQDERIKWVEED